MYIYIYIYIYIYLFTCIRMEICYPPKFGVLSWKKGTRRAGWVARGLELGARWLAGPDVWQRMRGELGLAGPDGWRADRSWGAEDRSWGDGLRGSDGWRATCRQRRTDRVVIRTHPVASGTSSNPRATSSPPPSSPVSPQPAPDGWHERVLGGTWHEWPPQAHIRATICLATHPVSRAPGPIHPISACHTSTDPHGS